jgi:probable rRNA maturation factor
VPAADRGRGGGTAGPRPPRLSLTVQYAVRRAALPAPATLRRWARAALERDAAVTLRFVGTREGRRLNAVFRGKDHATNVLTFVYDEGDALAGDIVLCTPVVRREAKAQGKTYLEHCAHLVVHGMLHLQGYDHESPRSARAMEGRETAILAGLGVPDPYAEPPLSPAGHR